MFPARRALLLPWEATTEATMESTLLGEIRRIQRLSVNELQAEWLRLYDGEPCRSRNRPYLVKRLCWRVQEVQLGGLSDRARTRIQELAPTGFMRAVTPPTRATGLAVAEGPDPAPVRRIRDARLPSPGSIISRTWRGRELRLLVLDDGYELDGVRYGSLSEAARAATGAHWNGRLFWGLTQRTRKK